MGTTISQSIVPNALKNMEMLIVAWTANGRIGNAHPFNLKDNDIRINQENFKFIDLNEITIESYDSVIYFKDLLDNKIINEILKKNKVIFDPEMLLYSKGIVNDQIRLLI